MFAIYNYAPGTTQANLVSDVIKLVTGETNKANLSANCVQANTNIISTVAAGWTLHDAAGGTNLQVVTSLNQDGVTYKFAGFQASSTTNLNLIAYESFNNSTHVGTNTCTVAQAWSSTAGGYLYIYATSKNLIIMPFHSATYYSALSFLEFSRDNLLAGYPCWGVTISPTGGDGGTSYPFIVPRIKNNTAAGSLTVQSCSTSPLGGSAGSSFSTSLTSSLMRSETEVISLVGYKVGVMLSNRVYAGLFYDVVAVGQSTGVALDEVTYNGTTHVLFKPNTPSGGWLLVPKA